MDYRRDINQRPARRLVRGADGRLRPAASGNSDIGDVWAEQKRIRLNEAILEDQRKAEKANRTSQKSKEVVFNISLPKLRIPKLKLANKVPKLQRKWVVAAGITLVLAAASFSGYKLFLTDGKPKVAKGVLTAEQQAAQKPDFDTVLPPGKSIEDLGGWARVSPPDKDPAFAYVDVVAATQLNVSQQLLPDSFRQDTEGELAKLAEQFSANTKLSVGDLVFYVGTSSKGPQSAIAAIGDLLVLIKSAGPLTNEQWSDYIGSLE